MLLLALPEFPLTDARIDERNELVAYIELPGDVQACPQRCVIDLHPLHDWRTHNLRHLPVAGRVCRLVWRKRLLSWTSGCETFAERTPSIAPGAVWTRPRRGWRSPRRRKRVCPAWVTALADNTWTPATAGRQHLSVSPDANRPWRSAVASRRFHMRHYDHRKPFRAQPLDDPPHAEP